MNKYFKILTTMMVVIALVACLGVFVACNDDTPATDDNPGTTLEEEYTYKFTVIDEDGNPVEGARVQLCKGDEFCKTPKKTDANGIVKFYADEEANNVPADVYDIHILNYEFDNTAYQTSVDVKDYTLTVSK